MYDFLQTLLGFMLGYTLGEYIYHHWIMGDDDFFWKDWFK